MEEMQAAGVLRSWFRSVHVIKVTFCTPYLILSLVTFLSVSRQF